MADKNEYLIKLHAYNNPFVHIKSILLSYAHVYGQHIFTMQVFYCDLVWHTSVLELSGPSDRKAWRLSNK